ncbi:MAG: ABC transporter permease [Thermanaerothrix sp.]|uniref:ABC transporter permease n=1 Tax=Thermanaerothrix solaris TaxID=3058434 RepID=A0ABU3NRA1_9CHLR|nr:ABC transporter permease [Thermanaerothrix sp. 4228-RoL]MDT8899362.1 ABC transporter permease [Thermanaerothrix sp. 4228-RoL]
MWELVLRGIFSALFVASVLRISTPLILPALGGLISELSGATNIALEGIMLVAAFTGVVISAYTQSVWLGVIAGMLSGVLVAGILAYFHLYLKADLILAGIALNIMATGGTIFLLYVLTGDKGSSSTLASKAVPVVNIPIIKDIPVLGTILSGHNIFTYLAFILTWLVSVFLYRTPQGVHLRAVGENPEAAASLGIDVRRVRLGALLLSGVLASLGGLNLSMAYLTLFQREMTAGRGFIALAAVFLGGRTPWGTLIAAVLFGFFDALSNQLGSLAIPSQWVQMIPYVATVLALVVYSLRQRAQAIERTRRFQEKHLAETHATGD